ncbi:MAG TPA: hypothetical protein VM076_20225 [Gemmatimonadaceae bacterium]|nr:hypothetical protein [Gemmatimonadaceae bacterium]
MRRSAGEGGGRGRARLSGNREQGIGNRWLPRSFRFPIPDSRFPWWLALSAVLLLGSRAGGQAVRLDSVRFTIVAEPNDRLLAQSLLESAVARDTFPGLPRPKNKVLIAIASNKARFRQLIGPSAPEWGAAVAFPESSRIVMQGRNAGADAGDPIEVLRHELAHLALHEAVGDLPPRWFDEGYASYAANEVARDAVLGANLVLLFRAMPPLDSLDAAFQGGSLRAEGAYALSYRAVAELAARDPERGLTLFFQYWKESGRFDQAVRRAYGITQSQFEEIWRSRTRRRYGGLALIADLSVAAALTVFIVLPFYVIRRRRDRLRMAALVRADVEAERRETASAIEALLRSIATSLPRPASDSPQSPPSDESSRPPQST